MPPDVKTTTSTNVKDSTAPDPTPVANGTYTVGLKLTGGGTDGTITNGVITAVQEAT